jgi:probable HAF family extracellular repeat protein
LHLEVLEDRCLLSYTITDLSPSFFHEQLRPHVINNRGQVIGLNFASHVLMWDPMTGIHDLGPGDGIAINDAGQVVGLAQFGQNFLPALWDSDGTVTPLPLDPIALTQTGQVIGSVGSFPNTRIRLWDPVSGVQDLGPLGSLGGDGYDDDTRDANGSGLVVGLSNTPDGPAHAYVWDSQNGMQDLGTLGPSGHSGAAAVNGAGQVVGGAYDNSSHLHAFLYDGTMHDLGTIKGVTSDAFGINDMGAVVGVAGDNFNNYHGFVYADGVMTDLNDLIDPGSGLTIYYAWAINNGGWIAADAHDAQGHRHSLVLTPDGGGGAGRGAPGVFPVFARVPEAADIGPIMKRPLASTLPEPAPVETAAALPAGAAVRRATDAVFAISYQTQPEASRISDGGEWTLEQSWGAGLILAT